MYGTILESMYEQVRTTCCTKVRTAHSLLVAPRGKKGSRKSSSGGRGLQSSNKQPHCINNLSIHSDNFLFIPNILFGFFVKLSERGREQRSSRALLKLWLLVVVWVVEPRVNEPSCSMVYRHFNSQNVRKNFLSLFYF